MKAMLLLAGEKGTRNISRSACGFLDHSPAGTCT